MSTIFDDAPHTTARVYAKDTTQDDLTDNASNTIFVEFVDAEGRPSRGSQDYPLAQHCSLEIDDEVEIAYVALPEHFDRLTKPFVRITTGILKLMLKVVGKSEIVDEALAESERFTYYTIKIINFKDYLS